MPKGETDQRKTVENRFGFRTLTVPLTNLRPEPAGKQEKKDNLILLATERKTPKQVKTWSLDLPEVICGDVIQLK